MCAKWVRSLWFDESGVVLSTEMVLMGSVLATGTIVGLATLRDTVTAELSDLANALSGISQAYSYSGVRGCSAETAGSRLVPEASTPDEAGAGDSAVIKQSCIEVELPGPSRQEQQTDRTEAEPGDLPFST